jgi:hypothetical protein
VPTATSGGGATPSPTATTQASPTTPPIETPTTPPNATPTTPPSATPTETPVETPSNAGPAVLGGTQDAFIARFGQPNDASTPAGGQLHFQRFSGTTTDFLIVQLDTFDGAAFSQRAFAITVNAPPGQPWSMETARSTCGQFLPSDASQTKQVDITTTQGTVGTVLDYKSATLASTFPAQAFVDISHNLVAPGSFDVFFHFTTPNDTSRIDSCELQVGLQQTPASVTGNG